LYEIGFFLMATSETPFPPILLPLASYLGTLAAVRCLGAREIPVVLAESERLVPAVWSRYAARRVASPSPQDPERFIEWLLEFGQREPGHVLYPTGDDVAFLYALHRDELAKRFVLRHPPIATTYSLLNKLRLGELAASVGLSMPRTWLPLDDAAFGEIEAEARFPVVIKPQTQAMLLHHPKGILVQQREDLRRRYAEFAPSCAYHPQAVRYDPNVSRPSVQEYVPHASEDVYGLSGFIDEEGTGFAVRASRKVLQQPRQVGVGLCFEEAEVLPELAQRVRNLLKAAGHFGVFEAEFIEDGGRHLLIDVNPRFYGQMAFDVARGLPLPLLAYHLALGKKDLLAADLAAASNRSAPSGLVYSRTFELKLLLALRRLAGTMSREETRRWHRWLDEHRGRIVDAFDHEGDSRPGEVEMLHHLLRMARHPRSFFRQVVLE
jgi:D-aspartate ligase